MLHAHTAEAEKSGDRAASIEQGLLGLNAAPHHPQLLPTSLPLKGFALSNTQTPWARHLDVEKAQVL